MFPGCLVLLVVLLLLFLFPLFLANFMLASLAKLGLAPEVALLVLIGIVIGGSVNIPVKRIPRDEEILVDPFALFGFSRLFPHVQRRRTYTVLAVNVGGCLIPCALALHEIVRILNHGAATALATALIALVNVAVCYRVARPVAGLGIAMPALVPPLVAVILTLLLVPEFAPPVAFVAGVLGPLLGADLLHLRDVNRLATGFASIGGAGTFDGIVLSGLIASFLS